jgi:hypothetical protein
MANYQSLNLLFNQNVNRRSMDILNPPDKNGNHTLIGRISGGDIFSSRAQKPLSMKRAGNDAVMTTPGGYTIKASSKYKAEGGLLEITSPDGKTTKVWGDPHVDQKNADGTSKRQFDFMGRTTFTLPDKTVITMNVEDKMLSDVMVTNGDEGVLCRNMLGGPDSLEVDTGYGPLMDELADDGNVLHMGKDGDFYMSNEFGGFRKVTQKDVDQREEMLNSGFGSGVEGSEEASLQEIFSQIQSLLSNLDVDFLSMVEAGSFQGSLSSYSNYGQFGMDYDVSQSLWN